MTRVPGSYPVPASWPRDLPVVGINNVDLSVPELSASSRDAQVNIVNAHHGQVPRPAGGHRVGAGHSCHELGDGKESCAGLRNGPAYPEKISRKAARILANNELAELRGLDRVRRRPDSR